MIGQTNIEKMTAWSKQRVERFALTLFATSILLSAIAYPIWLGSSVNDKDKAFTGVVGLYADESFYYLALGPAEMTDNQRLFGEDKFMRSDKAMFINPIGNFIALLSHVTRWDNTTSFFVYRIIAAILLMVSFLRLSRAFLSQKKFQLFALLIFAFGTGLDTCVPGLNACSWSVTAPELNTFIACIGEYYIPTATALFLFYIERLLSLMNAPCPQRRNLLLTGLLLFLLGAVYVYSMLIALLITASLLIYKQKKQPAKGHSYWKIVGWLIPFSLIVIVYYAWVYFNLSNAGQDEGWVVGPSLMETLLTNFWVAIPALFLVVFSTNNNREDKDWKPLAIWVATTLLITRIPPPYLPFQVQAHVGLYAPLCLMAATGLQKWYNNKRLSQFTKPIVLSLSMLLLFFSALPNWNFYDKMLTRVEQMNYPEFADKDELEAFSWIRDNLPQTATFAVVPERARMLAGTTGCRVFYRNTPFHELSETTEVLANWSKAIEKNDTNCPSSLTQHAISHVFAEKKFRVSYLDSLGIKNIPCSKSIYSSGEVTIWELTKQP
ncbi:MAG: hypothetical protein K9G41_00915 [Flavobacteriales bacterium]|nr:hypothetical protein [Flavobacteriales bacterium]